MQKSFDSSDGLFKLVVIDRDGDYLVGFEGFSWHSHGDVLSAELRIKEGLHLSPKEAVKRFVEDILENRAILAVEKENGKITNVWVTDDPEDELHYAQEGLSLDFRFWNGAAAI